MKDYFAILHIPNGANRDEVQQAYRRLAKKYHPDVSQLPGAHEKFCEITEAYEYLMSHWHRFAGNQHAGGFAHSHYDDFFRSDEYARFRQEVHDRARQQANMRYEKFRKQHEAFQESGLNDIALLFTIVMRLFSAALCLFLFLAPPVLAIVLHWSWILAAPFAWPFAIGIAWYYFDNRIHYFVPGKLYYTPKRIWQMYTSDQPSVHSCHYCKGKQANSRPYKIELFRIKEIKFRMGGFRQQQVNYQNDTATIYVPRSRKAFRVHTICSLVKLLCILVFFFAMDISSHPWRAITGAFAGGLLAVIIQVVTRTRSHVSYLFTWGFIIRLTAWLTGIAFASRFSISPFNIVSTDYIYFAVIAIVVFDSLIMQLTGLLLGKSADKPFARQYSEVTLRMNEGYAAYNDIPVLSFVYPLFKWIFG